MTFDAQIDEMQVICDIRADVCQTALEQTHGDVSRAISNLIDTGVVLTKDLNPDTATDEQYDRAARRQALAEYAQVIEEALSPKKHETFADLINASNPEFGKEADKVLPGANKLLQRMAAEREELLEKARIARAKQFEGRTPESMLADAEKKLALHADKFEGRSPGSQRGPRTLGERARMKQKTQKRIDYVRANPFILQLPPFPPLTRELHEWEGRDTFPAWKGIAARDLDDDDDSEEADTTQRSVSVTILRLDDDDANPRPPSAEQIASYRCLKDDGDQVVANVFAAVLQDYYKLRERWIENDPDLEEELPVIKTVEAMRRHIGLSAIYVHPVVKGDFGYIGLALNCSWDQEHGGAVILHGTRVVEVGMGDIASNFWAGRDDGGEEIA